MIKHTQQPVPLYARSSVPQMVIREAPTLSPPDTLQDQNNGPVEFKINARS
jgi:hypothetical protein